VIWHHKTDCGIPYITVEEDMWGASQEDIFGPIAKKKEKIEPFFLGIGDESGNILFVHGSYESIKTCRSIVLERDRYKVALKKIQDIESAGLPIWELRSIARDALVE
jgi:hypothetical protein